MVIKLKKCWIVLAAFLIAGVPLVRLSYSLISASTGDLIPAGAVCVPILVYHDVKPKITGYTISPREFENDLKYLRENHYTCITMRQLTDYVFHHTALPEKPIILSFDDGYLDNYKYVFPLIQKYNAKIVFSVIAKNTDDFSRYPDNNVEYAHVTWGQLREMCNSGLVEVQNHTYNLHSCKKGRIGCMKKAGESEAQYEKILSEDLQKCQSEIHENLGTTPNTFTYPYGKANPCTDAILKKLGFQATLSCNFGVNLITEDPESLYDLRRICRLHGKDLSKALKEGYQTLKYRKDTAPQFSR